MTQPQSWQHPIRSYAEFWTFYLAEHSRPGTRALHYLGTSLAVALILAGLVLDPRLLIAAPLAGYLFAWIGHFFVEGNRPATFRYPLWSLASDFRLWWLWLTAPFRRRGDPGP
ncbi:MAG: DUF962 domain-containing protein [Thalassobaculales bacterium]